MLSLSGNRDKGAVPPPSSTRGTGPFLTLSSGVSSVGALGTMCFAGESNLGPQSPRAALSRASLLASLGWSELQWGHSLQSCRIKHHRCQGRKEAAPWGERVTMTCDPRFSANWKKTRHFKPNTFTLEVQRKAPAEFMGLRPLWDPLLPALLALLPWKLSQSDGLAEAVHCCTKKNINSGA